VHKEKPKEAWLAVSNFERSLPARVVEVITPMKFL